jgi:AcrR family transcriptional regulator
MYAKHIELEHELNHQLPTREAHKQLTRERLIDAAMGVFLKVGYGNTAIADIASVAGVSRATFYLHFETKADVFLAALEVHRGSKERAEYWRSLNSALITGSRKSIRKWLEFAIDWYETKGRIHLVWQEAVAIDPHVAEYWDKLMERAKIELHDYLSLFTGDEIKQQTRVMVLAVQLDYLLVSYVVQKSMHLDREELLETLTESWLGALKTKER